MNILQLFIVKNKFDSIVNLTDETAVNLFIGMDKDLRDSTAKAIARNLKNGKLRL